MPPKKSSPPSLPPSPLHQYQSSLLSIRSSVSSLLTHLSSTPRPCPPETPIKQRASWEDSASLSAASVTADRLKSLAGELLGLRDALPSLVEAGALDCRVPVDLLDLLDHGSMAGLGVNPALYCRELVRRVLLLSD
eukprot:CAMPEP_0182484244 /NCGR_PEP_ID=MMETSP1319-20130603/43061_1 /TAXON_ID=172717 /ORGANISM="Bolidomonas pacifica, Strain RCC208" /LENGTH=135 /DNA_ID=CAMNT_0024686131 /DNA_START=27 /DNA_END=431 /DNA_ORIENTATION=+